MVKLRHIGVACVGWLLTLVALTSQAALIGVLPATPGGTDYQAYYDDVANLTWLANASASGSVTWADANTWAAGLNVNGVTGWRLPTNSPVNGSTYSVGATIAYDGSKDWSYNVSAPDTTYAGSMASEMAFLFYNTLGNASICNSTTSTVDTCDPQSAGTNTGPFSGIQVGDVVNSRYWSATDFSFTDVYCTTTSSCAWFFLFTDGAQGYDVKTSTRYAWAVYTGNAGAVAVPLPATVWLFSGGLLGLIGVARQRR